MDRPRLVTVAIVLFGLSLAFRIYSELSFLNFVADPAQYVPFNLGRAIVPIVFYAFQGWILWKVAHGKNWARITLMFFVLLNTGIAILVLGNPFGQFFVSPAVASFQVLGELVAVVLLLIPSDFFSRPQIAA